MFEIIFYEDEHGKEPVREFIEDLANRAGKSKDARVNLNKIIAYFDALEKYGTRMGEPVTKHLTGEIWELRPLSNRILYAYWDNDKFIMLHHFVKKTQKTPSREIDQAIRNLKSYLERHGDD